MIRQKLTDNIATTRGPMRLFCATVAMVLTGLGTASSDTAPKMKMTMQIPDSITTPESVDTRLGTLNFFDGFPDDATSEKIYDNLDFLRGVESFLNAMPGASMEAFRKGLASQGADDNQSILIFEDLIDSHSLFLTGNTESIYNLMWLDTKSGPLVVETPPNILGSGCIDFLRIT